MNTTVQIRNKGQITIPAAMRNKLGIEENEIMTVSLIGDDAILIIPRKLKINSLLQDAAKMAKTRGITLEEVLAELEQIRHNS